MSNRPAGYRIATNCAYLSSRHYTNCPMNADFQQEFKDYSTIELLKIVKQPGNYQPAAVAVAHQLLQGRVVTPEEEALAEQHFAHLAFSQRVQQARLDALKNK